MSLFSVVIGVGNPEGGDLTGVSAVVDTGAHHTMLPQSLLEQLRIQPIMERSIGFADGNRRDLGIGQAKIDLDDIEMICPVIFGPEEQYLLGVTTLEIFSVSVDPVNHVLVPVEFSGRAF